MPLTFVKIYIPKIGSLSFATLNRILISDHTILPVFKLICFHGTQVIISMSVLERCAARHLSVLRRSIFHNKVGNESRSAYRRVSAKLWKGQKFQYFQHVNVHPMRRLCWRCRPRSTWVSRFLFGNHFSFVMIRDAKITVRVSTYFLKSWLDDVHSKQTC